jgi:hypothetical protein
MRLVWISCLAAFAVCVIACGGGKKEAGDGEPAAGGPKAANGEKYRPKEKPEKSNRPPLSDVKGNYVDEYKENAIAADRKWKGRRVELDVQVSDFGKMNDGTLWVATAGFLGQPPNAYFYFAPDQEDAFAALKRGEVRKVRATCEGRKDDGLDRGVEGYGFRVNFGDAEFVGPPK